jgi:hypothetical protein
MQTVSVRFVDLKIADMVALPTSIPGERLVTSVVDLEAAYRGYGRPARYRVQFSGGKYQYVTADDRVDMVVTGSLTVGA